MQDNELNTENKIKEEIKMEDIKIEKQENKEEIKNMENVTTNTQ